MNTDPILPDEQRAQAVRITHQQLEISQSPWPPPDILERYEQVMPGSADRLIKMVEQEAEHRRALETKQLNREIRETCTGQWMAFLIGIFTIAAGAYTALQGAEWPGALMGSGGVIGLVAVFIYGRRQDG